MALALAPAPRLSLISLEPWDDTWRRNQHLTDALLRMGAVSRVLFVEPAMRSPAKDRQLLPNLVVHTPRRLLPMRLGGAREVAERLRPRLDREADLVWINDPVIGSHCATRKPTLYDVTDDWRETLAPPRVIRRIIAAEDRLARSATTVVCSKVLRSRWQERYDLDAHLVTNGVDAAAHATAARRHVPGDGPHVGYIGTLHEERLDIEILLAMAADPRIGTVHLVGPNSFGAAAMRRLLEAPRIAMHGPVPSADVPSWMASMDVLVCPHVLSAFTLSLDAIKSYEYLATGRPIVATPTSGFQELGERVRLSTPAAFVEDVMKALTDTREPYRPADATWDAKAEQMAEIIRGLTT